MTLCTSLGRLLTSEFRAKVTELSLMPVIGALTMMGSNL